MPDKKREAGRETAAALDVKGIVFDIQHYAVHDGPGIRTLVFLKGCNMSCRWCENPESIELRPEIVYFPKKCIGDFACVEACPEGAISADRANERIAIDRKRCTQCLRCAEVCTPEAVTVAGKELTARQVVDEVTEDRVFYGGRGGLTLSGGEPALQKRFAVAILVLAKKRGIDTALETNGNIEKASFLEIVRHLDHLLIDVKHMDGKKHRRYTGMGNEAVLSNLKEAVSVVPDIVVRVPVIPSFNMNDADILKIAEYSSSLGINCLHLLPYHALGSSKCENLGRNYPFGVKKSLSYGDVVPFKELVEKKTGMRVRIGG
ncbi:MAG: glycyl-radical enzyme activating protein [Spirochaetes bacterium]|nr:glycyl-radical enzyme activating protein [Spirochaetota bacterium]